jgi:hypothetical protein
VKKFFGAASKEGTEWVKVKRQSRQLCTQDGDWPQVPSVKKNYYLIAYHLGEMKIQDRSEMAMDRAWKMIVE